MQDLQRVKPSQTDLRVESVREELSFRGREFVFSFNELFGVNFGYAYPTRVTQALLDLGKEACPNFVSFSQSPAN